LTSSTHARHLINHLDRTTTQSQRRSCPATSDGANTRRVRETNLREEEADTNTGGSLDSGGYKLDEPLSHARESEEDKDETFDKDGGEGKTVGDGAAGVVADDLEGEVGVETHSGAVMGLVYTRLKEMIRRDVRNGDGEVCEEAKHEACHSSDGGGSGDKVSSNI
jgi:hypothetical protein